MKYRRLSLRCECGRRANRIKNWLHSRPAAGGRKKAAKLGIKIIFPVFFVILPTMFIVSVGPAILQIAKQLLPTFRQLHGGG